MFLFSKQGGPGPRKGRAGEHRPEDQKRSAPPASGHPPASLPAHPCSRRVRRGGALLLERLLDLGVGDVRQPALRRLLGDEAGAADRVHCRGIWLIYLRFISKVLI